MADPITPLPVSDNVSLQAVKDELASRVTIRDDKLKRARDRINAEHNPAIEKRKKLVAFLENA